MNKYVTLVKKTYNSIKYEGLLATKKRIAQYVHMNRVRNGTGGDIQGVVADILFINGCYLPHPHRYRVSHQIEELFSKNIICEEVDYAKLTLDLVKNYRGFIFYRCPYTDTIGEFIAKAKQLNKTVFYDIDDLVFDKSYTESVDYLKTLSKEELNRYYEGVELMKKTLQLCEYGITTTETLAEEMKKNVSDVYVNRNVASDEMLKLSQEAYESREEHEGIVLGYFSGSITHNDDVSFILPVLLEILKRHSDVRLLLAGEIDVPDEFKEVANQIITTEFMDWTKLPKLIASVDINIVPLKDTLFNRAKSENKWTEASLVRVPTIASNVGAFSRMIENNKTGILCDSSEDWINAIELLITNGRLRKTIGEKAFEFVFNNSITVTRGAGLANYIKGKLKPNVWFVIPIFQPRGGIGVALRHASYLQQCGYDVTIVNEGSEREDYATVCGTELPFLARDNIRVFGTIEKAVGTLYSTMTFVITYPNILERFYLVQGYETNFVGPTHYLRKQIEQTYNLSIPVKYVTISRWCQRWLNEKYCKNALYAPNGIDSKLFYPVERKMTGKIRILIEGNSIDHYKNVDESFKIIDKLDHDRYEVWYLSYEGEPKKDYRVDKFIKAVPYEEVNNVYRQCDILIKTSIFESFSYPPLEMMATGGYVVALQNDGNKEYLVNEQNCLIYDHGDIDAGVACVERIVSDSKLRKTLYENGQLTAKSRDWNKIKEDIVSLYI